MLLEAHSEGSSSSLGSRQDHCGGSLYTEWVPSHPAWWGPSEAESAKSRAVLRLRVTSLSG